MLVQDDNPQFNKYTHLKWKEMVPAITLDQSLYCEKLFLKFVNGEITESKFLELVNKYLKDNKLIK